MAQPKDIEAANPEQPASEEPAGRVEFARMQQVFLTAVEQHQPEDWDAYLDKACAGDDELRAQVKLLLKAHLEAGSVPGASRGGT